MQNLQQFNCHNSTVTTSNLKFRHKNLISHPDEKLIAEHGVSVAAQIPWGSVSEGPQGHRRRASHLVLSMTIVSSPVRLQWQ